MSAAISLAAQETFQEILDEQEGNTQDPVPSLIDFNQTDLGNAERLVTLYKNDLLYCHDLKQWLLWNGKYWEFDRSQRVMEKARETIRKLYTEALDVFPDADRKALIQHALRSEAEFRLKSMVNLAQIDLPILSEQIDHDPWLFNVNNGTLNLRTGELQGHRREDYLTKFTAIAYDENAECPQWETFLRHIFDNDVELIGFVQKAVGYSLTADIREQCWFILHGTGANGKSTLVDTLLALFGDYGQQADITTFMQKDRDLVRSDVAGLGGSRFVTASESSEGQRLAEGLIKSMTGGESLRARFLYSDFITVKPTFKLWLATNHRPVIRGTDHATWRRIRLLPFNVTIPEEQQDKTLPAKLREELPGILRWSVFGCQSWLAEGGLSAPESVKAATSEYRSDMDVLGGFLSECCVLNHLVQSSSGALYEAYKTWCETNGEKSVMTRTAFGRGLRERGLSPGQQDGKGRATWKGIGLRIANTEL